MSRRLAALAGSALLLGLGVLAPAAAHAAPTYPPAGSTISVATTTFTVGEPTTISFANFQALSVFSVRIVEAGVPSSLRAPGAPLGTSRGAAVLVPAATACSSTCSVTADSNGAADVDVTLTKAGKATITASGTGANGQPLTSSVTVTAVAADDAGTDDGTDDDGSDEAADPDAASGGSLAKTGTDILKFGGLGLGLLAVGTLLVVGVRRRSSGTPGTPA